jgi:hypothetical protein
MVSYKQWHIDGLYAGWAKLQFIEKSGFISDQKNIADYEWVTSTTYFNQQRHGGTHLQ